MRLAAAAQLLLDPALPIKAVAKRAGFPDVRYFTTVFRKYAGLPPGAYRTQGGTRFHDPARDNRGKGPGTAGRRKADAKAEKVVRNSKPRNLKRKS
jgi:AraC-like DNA-binding protein